MFHIRWYGNYFPRFQGNGFPLICQAFLLSGQQLIELLLSHGISMPCGLKVQDYPGCHRICEKHVLSLGQLFFHVKNFFRMNYL